MTRGVKLALALLALWAAAVLPTACHAQERGYEVTSGYRSLHLGSGGAEFNEANHGIGVEAPTGRDGLRAGVGVYKNSINRTSVYVGMAWRPLRAGVVSAGVVVGAATGYVYPVVPVVGLSVQADIGRAALHVLATPPAPETPAVIALQAKWEW